MVKFLLRCYYFLLYKKTVIQIAFWRKMQIVQISLIRVNALKTSKRSWAQGLKDDKILEKGIAIDGKTSCGTKDSITSLLTQFLRQSLQFVEFTL
jgi:hypothetical protein